MSLGQTDRSCGTALGLATLLTVVAMSFSVSAETYSVAYVRFLDSNSAAVLFRANDPRKMKLKVFDLKEKKSSEFFSEQLPFAILIPGSTPEYLVIRALPESGFQTLVMSTDGMAMKRDLSRWLDYSEELVNENGVRCTYSIDDRLLAVLRPGILGVSEVTTGKGLDEKFLVTSSYYDLIDLSTPELTRVGRVSKDDHERTVRNPRSISPLFGKNSGYFAFVDQPLIEDDDGSTSSRLLTVAISTAEIVDSRFVQGEVVETVKGLTPNEIVVQFRRDGRRDFYRVVVSDGDFSPVVEFQSLGNLAALEDDISAQWRAGRLFWKRGGKNRIYIDALPSDLADSGSAKTIRTKKGDYFEASPDGRSVLVWNKSSIVVLYELGSDMQLTETRLDLLGK